MSFQMENLSLDPDEDMRWIYNYSDPRYHSEQAKDLRERRALALRMCPQWMLDMAYINDCKRKNSF